MTRVKKRSSSGGVGFKVFFLFLIWLLAFVSAVAVVYSTYKVRQTTQLLEVLRSEASALQVVSGQYLLERSSQSEYSRIERIAKKQLGMVNPSPGEIVLVYKK